MVTITVFLLHENTGSLSANGLNAGAIAGIVLGTAGALLIGIIFVGSSIW